MIRIILQNQLRADKALGR